MGTFYRGYRIHHSSLALLQEIVPRQSYILTNPPASITASLVVPYSRGERWDSEVLLVPELYVIPI